jgi:hypothetical protein
LTRDLQRKRYCAGMNQAANHEANPRKCKWVFKGMTINASARSGPGDGLQRRAGQCRIALSEADLSLAWDGGWVIGPLQSSRPLNARAQRHGNE